MKLLDIFIENIVTIIMFIMKSSKLHGAVHYSSQQIHALQSYSIQHADVLEICLSSLKVT